MDQESISLSQVPLIYSLGHLTCKYSHDPHDIYELWITNYAKFWEEMEKISLLLNTQLMALIY